MHARNSWIAPSGVASGATSSSSGIFRQRATKPSVFKPPACETTLFSGTVERILSASNGAAVLMLVRGADGDPALLRAEAPLSISPGDTVTALATPLRTDIDEIYPVLRLQSPAKVTSAPRVTLDPDLEWIVSLLETAPPTPSLLGIADPDSFAADLPVSPDIDQRYHALNGQLIAEAVAPYWGRTEPVAGRAASPGVKHYGKIRGQRVRRTILVPYDARIARTVGFHGFTLTGPRDIAPIRLLSARGDRVLAAAHEAAHMLEPLVGIWPQQEHLSECFADAFAVMAIRSRSDADEFDDDLKLYRDMRLAGLLWGGSAHATGPAVAKALSVTPAQSVAALVEQAFRIAYACVGKSELRLRRRWEWLRAARENAQLEPNGRFDAIHLEAYREFLSKGSGPPAVRADIKRALRAFDRVAMAGARTSLDIRVARVFRDDLTGLIEAAKTREQAHLALVRTRHALDSGLPPGLRHDISCTGMTDLMRLRATLLDEASRKADELPSADEDNGDLLPMVVQVRRDARHDGVVDLLHACAESIQRMIADLIDAEERALKASKTGTHTDRELAATRAGCLLRKRVDLSIAVASDWDLLRSIHESDGAAADEIVRLASAPLPLLVRHKA